MILKIDRTPMFPTFVEIGIRRLFRVDVEITNCGNHRKILLIEPDCEPVIFGFCFRFGATVKTPLTGTIRKFGFHA